MKTKLVIFGITGDLSTRKLLPALSRIIATGEFDDLSIIGVSRRHVEQFEILGEHHEQLSGTTSMFTMDLSSLEDYSKLREYIDLQPDEQVLIYLSVPPESAPEIIDLLGQAGLNDHSVKLLLEKPFGTDFESARNMIAHIATHFDDAQVYRIDHYLAKEMAQNILIFRASNALFSTIWDNRFIEKVEIVAFEDLGIEGRAQFYEQTGALRDLVQGHLMQLLALAIMDLPYIINWEAVPVRRLAAVMALKPADPAKAIRGQYEGYREEVGNPASVTETYASIELESNDEKWHGVPLVLTTGKAMDKKRTEVRIHFKRQSSQQANSLIFEIQPNEGVELGVSARKPGYERELEVKKLHFDYRHDNILPDAYEQVLVDAIRSEKSLFPIGDEVLRAWEVLAPIQQAWKTPQVDLRMYPKGADPQQLMQ